MAATRYGLHLSHQTFIHTKPRSEPKRVLLAFKFSVDKCVIDDLTIELSRHVVTFEHIGWKRSSSYLFSFITSIFILDFYLVLCDYWDN